jgi:hypothetical protein
MVVKGYLFEQLMRVLRFYFMTVFHSIPYGLCSLFKCINIREISIYEYIVLTPSTLLFKKNKIQYYWICLL